MKLNINIRDAPVPVTGYPVRLAPSPTGTQSDWRSSPTGTQSDWNPVRLDTQSDWVPSPTGT